MHWLKAAAWCEAQVLPSKLYLYTIVYSMVTVYKFDDSMQWIPIKTYMLGVVS